MEPLASMIRKQSSFTESKNRNLLPGNKLR
jgi:hypothetical protein